MSDVVQGNHVGCEICGVQMSAAIAALSSFQQVTEQTDGKAGTIVTIQAGVAAVTATQVGSATGLGLSGAAAAGFWLLSVAGLGSFLTCAWLLASVLTPRIVHATAANRFSMAGAAACHVPGRPVDQGHDVSVDDVWRVAGGVAVIALRKSRAIARAIRWTVITLVLSTAWLVFVIAQAAGPPR